MQYQIRPMDKWPTEKTLPGQRRSREVFKAKWSDTLKLLERELGYLEAERIVIQCHLKNGESDIRNDGTLRASAVLVDPGVILSFESIHGPLSYPCDSCENWQHNVRSIALALQALRAVDRYGVTKRAEQYQGWAKISAPGDRPAFSSEIEAMAFLSDFIGGVIDSSEPYITKAIRRAKVKAHPDGGGTALQFKRVCEAEKVIRGQQ